MLVARGRPGSEREMSRRVVVTGMGGLSPIGREWKEVRDALEAGRTGVRRVDTWDDVEDFGTRRH